MGLHGAHEEVPCSLWWTLPWSWFWRSTWKRRDACGGYSYKWEVFAIAWCFIGVPYVITNNIAYLYLDKFSETFPETRWDREIPVIPWMMVPYCGLYVFYPLAAFLSPSSERGKLDLLCMMQGLMTASLFCCTIFMLFPTEIDMRDEIDWDDMSDISRAFFKFVHNGDHPWNAFPSLHVIHSYIVCRTITHWCQTDYVERGWSKPVLWAIWIEWVLLVISTMTTKQHYIFDAATGLVVGYTIFRWFEGGLKHIGAKGPGHILDYLKWETDSKRSIEATRLTDWSEDRDAHADDHIDI